jgi:hypothetical protein
MARQNMHLRWRGREGGGDAKLARAVLAMNRYTRFLSTTRA